MNIFKKTSCLSLSIAMAGLLLLLLASSLWAGDLSLTRVTTGARDYKSRYPSISGDGSKITFYSDADFLNQGNIASFQDEIWLVEGISPGGNGNRIYIPLIIKNTTP